MSNYVTTANIGPSISSFSFSNTQTAPLFMILSSVSASPNNHGFAAGNSVAMNGWDGNASYFQFTLNATGYQNLVLAWAGNVSGTGPTNMTLEYSSDGGATFNNFATFATPLNSSTTQDVSSVTAWTIIHSTYSALLEATLAQPRAQPRSTTFQSMP